MAVHALKVLNVWHNTIKLFARVHRTCWVILSSGVINKNPFRKSNVVQTPNVQSIGLVSIADARIHALSKTLVPEMQSVECLIIVRYALVLSDGEGIHKRSVTNVSEPQKCIISLFSHAHSFYSLS
jgi:hypothetical protein